MPFFHSSPILLGQGSVVMSGNFGRIIRRLGQGHKLWAREMALEAVRANHYPNKPSRLSACFTCTSEKTIRFYVAAMAKLGGSGCLWPAIYEVEKVEPYAPEHRSDFNVVEPMPCLNKSMEEIAHLYWTAGLWINVVDAPGVRCEEMITSSPLRIVRTLND